MLSIITDAFASKARVRIIIRVALSMSAQQILQHQVRAFDVPGVFKVVSGSHVEIDAESARPRLERLISHLRRMPILGNASGIEVHWLPFTKKFETFRVSL